MRSSIPFSGSNGIEQIFLVCSSLPAFSFSGWLSHAEHGQC